jgi:hypothetical protein
MKKAFWCLLGLFTVLFLCFLSCDTLRDSPFEVEGWSPGEGYHENPENLKVSLLLSHESDRAKTEGAFSLTQDSGAVKGSFSWEGRRLIFTPLSPLERNRDYRVSLGTGAQDRQGLSLEKQFNAVFTTRPPGARPRVLAVEPGWDGVLSDCRGPIRVDFSEPVTVNSCIDSISFSPSSSGSWLLENEDKRAIFIPSEPWQIGGLYKIKIASGFSDALGRTMEEEFTSSFSIGPDQTEPFLIHAWISDPQGRIELNPLDEYGEWESFHKLELEFSELVDAGSVQDRLLVEPAADLLMETPPGLSSKITFSFTEKPLWESSFLFRLRSGVRDEAGNESGEEYVYRIRAAGPLSRPPALVGIRLPMAPGKTDPEEQEPLSFTQADLFEELPIDQGDGRFPYGEETPVWIELYFDTGPDTSINLYSLMDLFRVEVTGNALYFSPQSVRNSDFSLEEKREVWEAYERVEIRGLLTNKINSGVVTFKIGAGLEDERGNSNNNAFMISLLK